MTEILIDIGLGLLVLLVLYWFFRQDIGQGVQEEERKQREAKIKQLEDLMLKDEAIKRQKEKDNETQITTPKSAGELLIAATTVSPTDDN